MTVTTLTGFATWNLLTLSFVQGACMFAMSAFTVVLA